ncbi:MAG: hypothetical protein ACRDFX_00730 [Chloroflexota bacterium]
MKQQASEAAFRKLLDFLRQLNAMHVWHAEIRIRAHTLGTVVRRPGQIWEVEFSDDGNVEIERFVSPGIVSNDDKLLDDFIAVWSDDDGAIARLFPYPGSHTEETAVIEDSLHDDEESAGRRRGFGKLLDFLNALETEGIDALQAATHPGSLAIISDLPGQYWDIEFFPDGEVAIERYVSTDVVSDDDGAILEDFFAARRGDKDAIVRLDLWPPFEGLDADLQAEWPYVTWDEARARRGDNSPTGLDGEA